MGGDHVQELFITAPPTVEPLRAVRSTLIISSIATLRDAGHGALYESALPAKHHPTILQSVAGMWIPLNAAIAHYEACDSLGLSTESIAEIGRDVGTRIQGTLLGTVARMAKGAGISPWTVLPQFPRFWSRAYDGGAVVGYRIGPKEARLEVHKAALCESRYFRLALCGVATSVLDMFCGKAYMRELAGKRPPGAALFRVQWA